MSTNHDDTEPKIMRSNTAMYPGETRTAGNTLIWPQPPTLPDDVKYTGPGFYGQPTIKLPYTTPAMTDAPKPEPDEKDKLIAELRTELAEEKKRADIDTMSHLRNEAAALIGYYKLKAKYHRLKAQQCDALGAEARRSHDELAQKLMLMIQDPWGPEDDDLLGSTEAPESDHKSQSLIEEGGEL